MVVGGIEPGGACGVIWALLKGMDFMMKDFPNRYIIYRVNLVAGVLL
jgi:hypothetical protein